MRGMELAAWGSRCSGDLANSHSQFPPFQPCCLNSPLRVPEDGAQGRSTVLDPRLLMYRVLGLLGHATSYCVGGPCFPIQP